MARCDVLRNRHGALADERDGHRAGAHAVATFYATGMEHSLTSATGTVRERTPWHATQRAAWTTADAT